MPGLRTDAQGGVMIRQLLMVSAALVAGFVLWGAALLLVIALR